MESKGKRSLSDKQVNEVISDTLNNGLINFCNRKKVLGVVISTKDFELLADFRDHLKQGFAVTNKSMAEST